jgi:hypothetical protein
MTLGLGASDCHAQPSAAGGRLTSKILLNGRVRIEFDKAKGIQVEPRVAFIGRDTSFAWDVKLPEGYTLEIDFEVHQGVKGPFVKPAGGQTGRYQASKSGEIAAGKLAGRERDAWKYSVIVRDQKTGEDVMAIDPMVADIGETP